MPRRFDEDRPTTTTTIPKRGGGSRVLTRLSPPDDSRYRAAVAAVAVRTEATLRDAVVAERATIMKPPDRTGPTFAMEDFRSARRRFRSRARSMSRTTPGQIVVADVRSFFASVTPDVVGGTLLRMGCHPAEVGSVLRLLERFAEGGSSGLPIGPHASAILANAVLAPVDDAIASTGARHLRWVDDFVIFPARSRDVEGMLDRVSAALGELGLELAHEKCAVGELRSTALGRLVHGTGRAIHAGPLPASLG